MAAAESGTPVVGAPPSTVPATSPPVTTAAPVPSPSPTLNMENLRGILGNVDPNRDRKPEERSVDDVLKIRDPFKRPVLAPAANAPRHPLLKFATNEYKMVGVIKGKGPTRAMILAPDGGTYFVKRSDKIGLQQGTITAITPQHVEVSEKVPNILGKFDDVVTLIQLPPDTALGVASAAQEVQAQNANEEIYLRRDRNATNRAPLPENLVPGGSSNFNGNMNGGATGNPAPPDGPGGSR
ncbi:MAG: pilus assembly protein PilP [Bacteriovoracia bacterium]